MASEKEKFFRLYEPVHPNLSRFVQAMVRNEEDAKDIISQTVLVAYDSFGKLRNRQAFLGFLFGIAHRLIKRHFSNRKHMESLDTQEVQNIASGAVAQTKADVAILNRALEALPLEQQEAVILFEVTGLPLKEIAAMQGVSLSTVKSRVTRGREKLRMMLTDQESAKSSKP